MRNNYRLFSRMSLPVAVLAVLLAFLPGPAAGKERITILNPGTYQPVIGYGVRDLSSILKDKFDVRLAGAPDKKGWNIVLTADTAMRPFSFSVRQADSAGYTIVYLGGHDETCVLHAVYTMLQVMGYTFDLTGIRQPRDPSLQRLAGYNRVIRPAVEWRGIRQHINFLMDISSYPVEEAKAYIRNLARMRMNCITFHSYPGQWYDYTYQGTRQLAGNFFYGEVDSVPSDKRIRRLIRNKSVYCIPEIEPYWDDHEKRSQMAIAWLNDVMAEAKKVGMRVRFSYELRTPGIGYARATCLAIVQEYPRIDELEFITEEDVPGYKNEITNDVACAKALRDLLREKHIQLSTGVYNTTEEELRSGFTLLRDSAPPDMTLTVLPAHGARMADRNLAALPFTATDIGRTMIYSWIQLDGMMYLQQNPVEGIRALIDNNLQVNGGKPLYGICWNHWQNYENRTAALYAAAAMIEGPLAVRNFYDSIGAVLDIGDTARYAAAMAKMDATDDYCRQNIVTIGFCPKVYWFRNFRGISHYGRYKKDRLLSAIAQYSETENELRPCIRNAGNKDSKRDMEMLVNRIECSIDYLRAFVAMTDLQPLFKHSPDPVLSREDSNRVVRQSQLALGFEEDYLKTFSACVADRGCEGTLVSFYSVPLQALKDIISKYQHGGGNAPRADKQFDAPPAPK